MPSSAVVCRFSVIVPTPGTVIVVFRAGCEASGIAGMPSTRTAPPEMVAVPDTAPVVVLKVHDDVTFVAPRVASLVSVAVPGWVARRMGGQADRGCGDRPGRGGAVSLVRRGGGRDTGLAAAVPGNCRRQSR
jgi:hypothetical protein